MQRRHLLQATSAALLAGPALLRAQTLEKPKLTLAVGGKNLLYYLPLTIAEQRGYFKDEGLDVAIVDFAGGARALQAGQRGRGDARVGHAVAADVEDAEVAETGVVEVVLREQQVGGGRTVEAEAAFAAGVERNEGERGVGLVGATHVAGADAGFVQAVEQEVAEHVLAEHADEPRIAAEARDRDCDVGRGATGALQQVSFTFRQQVYHCVAQYPDFIAHHHYP